MRRYALSDLADVDQLVAGLVGRERLERDPATTVERTLHDTFDWRLFGEGTVLEHQRDPGGAGTRALLWRSVDTGEQLGRLDLDEVPRFAWHLPASPVAERLARVVEMRALLPMVTITSTRRVLRMVDDEHKTVARLVVDRSHLGDRPLAPVIEVRPVRGYGGRARELTDLLDAQVLLHAGADDPLVTALDLAGYQPGAYSSKLRVSLDHASTARDAFVTVLRALLGTMVANEAGLRDDTDSEFLHDFRVAVRRTRSVLGQAKRVLPAESLAHFANEFRWLGQATGPTRDFDVFLLTLPEFEAGLPPERRGDLKPFQAFLEQHQHAAHLALVADLDSPRYAVLLDEWRAFLDDPPADHRAPEAERPAGEVAAQRIAKAHKGLVRDGRAVTVSSPPEDLHELRKDAKKLRYLLECFGSLFPPDATAPIVKQLKSLQDVLGEYQDCQVQVGSLERFGQEMLDEQHAPASALIALGSIVEQLVERERAARNAFDERFAHFDTRAVRRAVASLADIATAGAASNGSAATS